MVNTKLQFSYILVLFFLIYLYIFKYIQGGILAAALEETKLLGIRIQPQKPSQHRTLSVWRSFCHLPRRTEQLQILESLIFYSYCPITLSFPLLPLQLFQHHDNQYGDNLMFYLKEQQHYLLSDRCPNSLFQVSIQMREGHA